MTKFKTIADYRDYKHVAFWDMQMYASVSADFNTRPTQPHVCLTFYPHVKKWKQHEPSGLDQHHHMALSKTNARRLRDWLNKFLEE